MPQYALFDRSQAPIYTVTFTGNQPSDQEFEAYLDECERNYDSQEPMTVIFDARNASIPSWKHQQMQAQWLKNKRALIQLHCKGIVYVIANPIIRNVLKVILSLQSMPVEYVVLPDFDQAIHWCSQRLEET